MKHYPSSLPNLISIFKISKT